MASFSPINTAVYARNPEESTTPTTPRPSTAPSIHPHPHRMDDATTPTRANFGALANQRPLPTEPFPAAIKMPDPMKADTGLRRDGSQHTNRSHESDDVDMDDDEGSQSGSEEESVNADGTRTKKKKSQRFFCTEFPPCTLSFTRSEHLARHIRKHTGERPFQCHCSRRFSRLDNLRQHAQTVHVNEEIPPESLAATGTRFQRQVRTDRVRPPGNRSRAGTAGSIGSARGHQRNALSASSISSVGSYGPRDDRRRPPPLVMAPQRYSGEYHPESPAQQYRPYSPGSFNTPTSATFSTGQNSPRWSSAMQSPNPAHARPGMFYSAPRTPGRRLSVPAANNPFQSPQSGSYRPAPFGNVNSSNSGAFSPTSSVLTSPTSSNFGHGRRDSMGEQWKRNTWAHPEFTSRLQSVMTPNYYIAGNAAPQAPVVPSNAPPLQNMRLPGIESFDPLPPQTPSRRPPSPMMIDTPSRSNDERPNSQYSDMGLNRLQIAPGSRPMDGAGAWASEADRAVQAQAEPNRAPPPIQTVRFEESQYSARAYQHQSAPPVTPREVKRQAWYHGPVTPQTPVDPRIQRTSPDDSGSSEGVPGTPSSASVGEYNPTIIHSNGFVENRNVVPVPESRIVPSNAPSNLAAYTEQANTDPSYPYPQGAQPEPAKEPNDDMKRLEALVAVATNEKHVATAY